MVHRPRYRPWLRRVDAFCRRPALLRRRISRYLLPAVLGIGLALLAIRLFDASIRPLVSEIAQAKAKNAVTTIINDTVSQAMAAQRVSYTDLVTLQMDSSGYVTAMTTNSAQMNALRTEILGEIVAQVDSLDSTQLGVPLGNLTSFTSFSGRGPVLPVQVISVATADAGFRSAFSAAGINQTIHQIMLDVTVEAALLIPGGTVETTVEAQVCIAETVIVGQVPSAYLELPGGSP